jgi:hypothetical protein
MKRRLTSLVLSFGFLMISALGVSPASAFFGRGPRGLAAVKPLPAAAPAEVYLPLVLDWTLPPEPAGGPRINAPYFSGKISYSQMAIAWFGKVDSTHNYADVRTGYNDTQLYVNLSVFDRYLWYDTTPTRATLADWDAVSLYLDTNGNQGGAPGAGSYRFDAQLNWYEPRVNYQAAYRGNGSGWSPSSIDYSTTTGWQGASPNQNSNDDRGWIARFFIPFESLGIPGAPAQGTVWGMALVLHDRDNPSGAAVPVKTWPRQADTNRPTSWGQVRFGLPVYQAPPSNPGGTVVIRHGENGASVIDGEVGGGAVCGRGLDFWTEWGDTPSPGSNANPDFNIQNQGNVEDWPCFSKVYLTFPLGAIPEGKVIRSARLVLHLFGGSDPSQAQSSSIQALMVSESWNEATLTWNNAPYAAQNISATRVEPYPDPQPDWPGARYEWDVSLAAAQANASRNPLRLALYSADFPMHSGKYFSATHTGDWNSEARPTLIIEWGDAR